LSRHYDRLLPEKEYRNQEIFPALPVAGLSRTLREGAGETGRPRSCAGTPEIVAAHFLDAVRWSNDRHQEHGATMRSSVSGLLETKLVRGMERALARTARPFHLRITEIPVLGQHLWQLRPDYAWVSSALLQDTAQYRQQLTPVVEALF
jgi:hypothetical protein